MDHFSSEAVVENLTCLTSLEFLDLSRNAIVWDTQRGSKLNMMSESVTHDGWRPYPIYWVLICWERNSTSKTHISISSSNCQNLCCCARVQWLTSGHLLGMWPWQQKTIARYYWTILVCCWVYTYVWNLSIYTQMVLKHLAKEVCKSDPWTFRRKQILIIRLRSYVEVGYMEIVPILQGLYSICKACLCILYYRYTVQIYT